VGKYQSWNLHFRFESKPTSVNSQYVPRSKHSPFRDTNERAIALWGNIFCVYRESYESHKHAVIHIYNLDV